MAPPPKPEDYYSSAPVQPLETLVPASAPAVAAYYGPPAPTGDEALAAALSAVRGAAKAPTAIPPAVGPVSKPMTLVASQDTGPPGYRPGAVVRQPEPATPPVFPINPSRAVAVPPAAAVSKGAATTAETVAPTAGPPPGTVRQPTSVVREHPQAAPGGGGGVGKPNPDPYGVKAATDALIGTYGAQKDVQTKVGAAHEDNAVLLADQHREIARRQEEDAAIDRLEAEQREKHFEQSQNEIQQQIDDVRSKKIDPTRLMRDKGMGVVAVVGGLLGGLYQGLTKSAKNPFLEDLDRMIDRDIAAQEKDLDTQKAGIQDRMNLLGQQRQTFRDAQTAKLQARNLYYESAKEQLAAQAAQYQGTLEGLRAQEGYVAVDRQQKEIELQLARQRQQAAAQAAASGLAQLKQIRDLYRETFDKMLAAGYSPEQANQAANAVGAQLYGGGAPQGAFRVTSGAGGDPVAAVPKDQRGAASKEMEEYAKVESGLGAISSAFAAWRNTSVTNPRQLDSARANLASAVKKSAGPGMSSDQDYKNFIEPNLPAFGDSDETLRVKERNLATQLRGGVATPTLDRYSPGWKGPQAPQKERVQ